MIFTSNILGGFCLGNKENRFDFNSLRKPVVRRGKILEIRNSSLSYHQPEVL